MRSVETQSIDFIDCEENHFLMKRERRRREKREREKRERERENAEEDKKEE